MDASTRKTKNHIVRFDVFSDEYSIQRNEADCRAGKIEAMPGPNALDDLFHLGNLSTWDGDPRSESTLFQALRYLAEKVWIGLLDSEIVDHRKRLCADAEHVV